VQAVPPRGYGGRGARHCGNGIAAVMVAGGFNSSARCFGGIQKHKVHHPRRDRTRHWSVAIHLGNVESAGKVVSGGREQAEALARSMIDNWLDRHQWR
jgi:hypothetical protein